MAANIKDILSAGQVNEGDSSLPSIYISILNFCFVLICFFPYGWISPPLQAGFAMAVAALCYGVALGRRSLDASVGYILFTCLVLGRCLLSLADVRSWEYFVSQANSYWQFIYLLPALCVLIRYSDWDRIIQGRLFFYGLIIASVVDIAAFAVLHGAWQVHTISIPLMFLFVRSYTVSRPGRWWAIVVALGLSMVIAALVTRTTLVLLLVAYLSFLLVNPSNLLLRTFCVMAALAPGISYMFMSVDSLLDLHAVDYNTFIRGEFIRASLGYLTENWMFGVGFDHPYRDINYAYLYEHPLLTDPLLVNTVSNHNSLYDAGLRLGVLGPILLLSIAFLRPRLGWMYPYKPILMLIVSFGVSANAAFEDQRELLQTMMALAILTSGRPMDRRASQRG